MNSSSQSFVVLVCALLAFLLCLQRLPGADARSYYSRAAGRHARDTLGYGSTGPRVLKHLIKQPILSFGSWYGGVGRSKRDFPHTLSARQLRRALRQQQLQRDMLLVL